MALKTCLAGAFWFTISAVAGVAAASGCEFQDFENGRGDVYATAASEFYDGASSARILETISPFLTAELNCYEIGLFDNLIAHAYERESEHELAANALTRVLASGVFEGRDERDLFLRLAVQYREFDTEHALIAYEDWMDAGGVPDATQSLTLAELYQQTNRYDRAFKYAEIAYREATSPHEKEAADSILSAIQKRRLLGQ
ncbi:MAG: hypothetical protein CMK09_18945 [Ponticaulis sp.]|nr:hypothetical protein [Ponticaulis sp.]|tara:strand:- start:160525 stop:161127 length:603 start_codon:yes stop_codon:yes gene_type:complete